MFISIGPILSALLNMMLKFARIPQEPTKREHRFVYLRASVENVTASEPSCGLCRISITNSEAAVLVFDLTTSALVALGVVCNLKLRHFFSEYTKPHSLRRFCHHIPPRDTRIHRLQNSRNLFCYSLEFP